MLVVFSVIFFFSRSNPDGYGVAPHCLDPGTVEHVTVENFDGQNWEQQIETSDIRSKSKEWSEVGVVELKKNYLLLLLLNLGVLFAAQKNLIFFILWHNPGLICKIFFSIKENISESNMLVHMPSYSITLLTMIE